MWGRGAEEGFPQKVSLSRQRCGNTQGKDTPGRGNHRCKGPEVGCAHGLEECREAGSAGVHNARVKGVGGDEGGEERPEGKGLGQGGRK